MKAPFIVGFTRVIAKSAHDSADWQRLVNSIGIFEPLVTVADMPKRSLKKGTAVGVTKSAKAPKLETMWKSKGKAKSPQSRHGEIR